MPAVRRFSAVLSLGVSWYLKLVSSSLAADLSDYPEKRHCYFHQDMPTMCPSQNFATQYYTFKPSPSLTHRAFHPRKGKLTGPINEFCDYRYLVIIVDRFSRLIQAIPFVGISSDGCASDLFTTGWHFLVVLRKYFVTGKLNLPPFMT